MAGMQFIAELLLISSGITELALMVFISAE